MKANRLVSTLLLLFAVAAHLPSQQAETDRKPLEEIKAQAEKGEAEAQFKLGSYYATGDGVAEDPIEGVKWFRKAAEQGHLEAQCNLGWCYHEGNGVARDYAEAVKWYQKAADKNYPPAQLLLGMAYTKGEGVPLNYRVALDWYLKAAEQNDASAQFNVASCYFEGNGVQKDEVEAVRWLQKAADKGMSSAEGVLGTCYLAGRGAPQDYALGIKWLRKAAEQGDATGMTGLGVAYFIGQGVPEDFVEAYKWINLAVSKGVTNGIIVRDQLRSLLTPEQIAEAQRLAREFKVRKTSESGASASSRAEEAETERQNLVAAHTKAIDEYKKLLDRANAPTSSADERERHKRAAEAKLIEINELRQTIDKHDRQARALPDERRQIPFAAVRPIEVTPGATGTGFYITEDGFLVTNEHVVRNAAQIRLVTRAGMISAKVVKVDAANDLALLKAEPIHTGLFDDIVGPTNRVAMKFAALPVAASRGVKLGGTVATVGFPNIGLQGFAPKLAKGEIASLSGAQDDARYFQISVPVQPGNSGGALVDERGNVVGVVSAKLSARAALSATGTLPENVNYAVKSSYLLSFLESVPEVSAKLKEPNAKERKFEDVVKSAEQAAVLVLVY